MTVTLNGREYPLRFTVNALCRLEEKTGRGLGDMQSGQLSCVRGLLWCGLLDALPQLTLEETGGMMDAHLRAGGSLSALSDALATAIEDDCFFPPAGRKSGPGPSP